MKQLYTNLKKGEIRLKAENLDDLWYLSTIIEPKDIIKGKTLRKIKIGEKEQRKLKIIKKPVFIKVEAEKIEFSKHSNILRISGIIREAPEDIQKGSHHTFNVEENSIITIIKEKWLKYQLDKLKEAYPNADINFICGHLHILSNPYNYKGVRVVPIGYSNKSSVMRVYLYNPETGREKIVDVPIRNKDAKAREAAKNIESKINEILSEEEAAEEESEEAAEAA